MLGLRSFVGLFFLIPSLLVAEHSQRSPTSRAVASDRELFQGATDLHIQVKDDPGTLCQSTLVDKHRTEAHSDKCRMAFVTAAHCVDEPFDAIEFAGVGAIPKGELSVCIPREYRARRAMFWKKQRDGVPRDLSTLLFETSCSAVEHLTPAPLAPVLPDGTTQVDSKRFFLQKRTGAAPGNPGGAKRIQADLESSEPPLLGFFAPSPQGAAIVGGDSGGPIYNEKGQLICPMATSSYEYLRRSEQLKEKEPDGKSDLPVDPFKVSCDARAIQRIREHLAGASPDC